MSESKTAWLVFTNDHLEESENVDSVWGSQSAGEERVEKLKLDAADRHVRRLEKFPPMPGHPPTSPNFFHARCMEFELGATPPELPDWEHY